MFSIDGDARIGSMLSCTSDAMARLHMPGEMDFDHRPYRRFQKRAAKPERGKKSKITRSDVKAQPSDVETKHASATSERSDDRAQSEANTQTVESLDGLDQLLAPNSKSGYKYVVYDGRNSEPWVLRHPSYHTCYFATPRAAAFHLLKCLQSEESDDKHRSEVATFDGGESDAWLHFAADHSSINLETSNNRLRSLGTEPAKGGAERTTVRVPADDSAVQDRSVPMDTDAGALRDADSGVPMDTGLSAIDRAKTDSELFKVSKT